LGSGGTGPEPSAKNAVDDGGGRGGTGPLPSATSVNPLLIVMSRAAGGFGSGGTGPDPSATNVLGCGGGRGGTGPLPSARSVKLLLIVMNGTAGGFGRATVNTPRIKLNSFREFIFMSPENEIWAERPS